MEDFIKQLSAEYGVSDYRFKDNQIIFRIYSKEIQKECPHCGQKTLKVHSQYERELQDLSMQNKQVILLVLTRRFLCSNKICSYKTFPENHPFVRKSGKKTIRLENYILRQSLELSSVNSSKLLLLNGITACKSTICEIIKKNFDS